MELLLIIVYICGVILQADRFSRILSCDYREGLDRFTFFEKIMALGAGIIWPLVSLRIFLRLIAKVLMAITQ